MYKELKWQTQIYIGDKSHYGLSISLGEPSSLDQTCIRPKPATRGGVNGSRSKFLSKSIRRPISWKSPQTLNLRYENSYGLAISHQHTLENFAKAKEPTRCESQNTAEGTGQTAHWDRSDQLGWSRCPKPVRPVSQTGQTGRSQTAHNQSSKWPISSKRSPNPTKLGG